ncbi:MAG: thioesterase family protein, partial [Pseudomonadota bacterium]
HLTYLGEIHAGDQVVTTFHLLDADEKRVHYFMELYRTSDGLLSATSEQIAMHVSMETRRSAPFPAEIAETIAAMASTQANLIRKPQVGHVIGIRRKPTGV